MVRYVHTIKVFKYTSESKTCTFITKIKLLLFADQFVFHKKKKKCHSKSLLIKNLKKAFIFII